MFRYQTDAMKKHWLFFLIPLDIISVNKTMSSVGALNGIHNKQAYTRMLHGVF